ncbi:hypothetical protein NEUTE1DRAFT_105842 [Neurospora tetrasperma FGSC 2508]|uniref:Uncharacterized protein n=1 Tax=Neurospora tetrasperma (strain FGSC 2508 / ATCC MYA-4615 / P0657) TaxID=510951 RepID=F8MZJ3_NEUT8|nr:uncharacterized protein NEUTE1DRAFT_105842 [Neurospora tetrasperma FGSC 2508]EGO52883.1 hypothetical protein NEUTE1DRAFT_105842 [Neurospora tetrasperma FGSC 2508]
MTKDIEPSNIGGIVIAKPLSIPFEELVEDFAVSGVAEENRRESLFDALGRVGSFGELCGSRCKGEEVDGKRGSTGLGDLKFRPGGVDRNDDDDDVDRLSEAVEPVHLETWIAMTPGAVKFPRVWKMVEQHLNVFQGLKRSRLHFYERKK